MTIYSFCVLSAHCGETNQEFLICEVCIKICGIKLRCFQSFHTDILVINARMFCKVESNYFDLQGCI
jgi:hypothetical protein